MNPVYVSVAKRALEEGGWTNPPSSGSRYARGSTTSRIDWYRPMDLTWAMTLGRIAK
jgi:hypothetical protein